MLAKKIVTRIDQEKFKNMVLIAIILISIKFILDGVTASFLHEKILDDLEAFRFLIVENRILI